MTMTDPPSGITKFDDFVHTTYIYKLKVPLKKMLILKFIICKKSKQRNKSDVDGMWEIWKTLFVDVLNKHTPIQSKRIRKRGNIPWLNSEVKAKLFKRDSLKKGNTN